MDESNYLYQGNGLDEIRFRIEAKCTQRWSLPSDFDLPEKSILYPKRAVHACLKQLSFPYTLPFNDPFADCFARGEGGEEQRKSAFPSGAGR